MKKYLYVFFLLLLVSFSCTKPNPSPRQLGYFRFNLPEKVYYNFQPDSCLFSFELPTYFKVISTDSHPCWFTLTVPQLKAQISFTYYSIDNNLEELLDDSYTLAYKHSIRAEDIHEKEFINNKGHVFVTVFDIKGNAASAMQFHITDSVKHFLRGSLYFRTQPNRDSLQPAIDFLEKDIIHLIETFRWK